MVPSALVFDPNKVKLEPADNLACPVTPVVASTMQGLAEGALGSQEQGPQEAILVDGDLLHLTPGTSSFDFTKCREELRPVDGGVDEEEEEYVPQTLEEMRIEDPVEIEREQLRRFRALETCIKTTQLKNVVENVKGLQSAEHVRDLLVMADIESENYKVEDADEEKVSQHSVRCSLGALDTVIDLLEERENLLDADRMIPTVDLLGSKRRIKDQWRSSRRLKKACRRGEAVEYINPPPPVNCLNVNESVEDEGPSATVGHCLEASERNVYGATAAPPRLFPNEIARERAARWAAIRRRQTSIAGMWLGSAGWQFGGRVCVSLGLVPLSAAGSEIRSRKSVMFSSYPTKAWTRFHALGSPRSPHWL